MVAKKSTPDKAPATKKPAKKLSPAQQLARLFYETYERMAPDFGYTTNKATRKFNPASPNAKLMVAVAQEILDSIINERGQNHESN